MARALGVETVAVHAYPEPLTAYGDHEGRERARHAARMRALEDLAEVGLRETVDFAIEAQEGNAAGVIARVAAECDAPFVAVGSRGRGPFGAAVLGSVSASLMQSGERPVLVVPPAAADRAPLQGSAVACIVDGSPESRAAAALAAELCDRLPARLVVLHARAHVLVAAGALGGVPLAEDPGLAGRARESIEYLVAEVSDGVVIRHIEAPGAVASALADAADSADASLVVVGDGGHGAALAALLGTPSRRLTASAPLPVLVVPEPASPR
jgi:nucleotide-binding universal stress UspA family protein